MARRQKMSEVRRNMSEVLFTLSADAAKLDAALISIPPKGRAAIRARKQDEAEAFFSTPWLVETYKGHEIVCSVCGNATCVVVSATSGKPPYDMPWDGCLACWFAYTIKLCGGLPSVNFEYTLTEGGKEVQGAITIGSVKCGECETVPEIIVFSGHRYRRSYRKGGDALVETRYDWAMCPKCMIKSRYGGTL